MLEAEQFPVCWFFTHNEKILPFFILSRILHTFGDNSFSSEMHLFAHQKMLDFPEDSKDLRSRKQ